MDVKVAKEVKAVSMGVPIFDAVAVLLLIAISQFSIPMLIGIIFGSVVAVNLPPGKAQAYTGVRYMIRLTITAAALIVSIKNPNLHIIGTAIGLISTQVVIFIKTFIVSKFKRKEV